MNDHTATDAPPPAPAVGARLEPGGGRLVPARVVFERWLTEKYPGTALDRDEWNDWQYKAFDVRVAWDAWRAGRAHLIDTQEPAAWVFEWGAVALPHGHPSRITCMSAHPTKAEALALAESPGYNEFSYLVYPAYCVDESGPPNVRANLDTTARDTP